MKHLAGAICCLVLLHSPDGSILLVEKESIHAVKPVSAQQHDHLAGNTHSVIFLGEKSGFGVAESVDQVKHKMDNCK